MPRGESGRYRLVGRGADLSIEVSGPTAEACFASAVEGFAAALTRVESSVDRQHERITVPGREPEELLVNLLDEAILRLDADGQLAVGLDDVRLDGDGLHAWLELVTLADVRIHGAAPKAATWHEVRLERAGGRWQGHVMLDL